MIGALHVPPHVETLAALVWLECDDVTGVELHVDCSWLDFDCADDDPVAASAGMSGRVTAQA